MKMKLNPRPKPKQKLKLSAKLLIVAAIVAAGTLLTVYSGSTTSVQLASFNSGRCLTFNGTSSEVDFSTSDLELGSGNKMTVTAWIKWSNKTTCGSWANIVALNDKNGSSGDVGQFWLQHSTSNSNFEFAVQNTAGTRTYIGGTTDPSVGTWYHVAGVYDGSYIYLYVNGVLEGKTAQTGNINNFQGNFKLEFGKWANSGDSYRRFNGDIDEVTIWNTALTQTQIRTNMCLKLKGNESGLVGYWRMNESSGTTVTDFTSNARNGTSLNTTISMSGAPIGDASTYTYGTGKLSISNSTYGDSLTVSSFSATPVGIQLYRIDTVPDYTGVASAASALAVNYYYGVYIVNPNGETYQTTFYYNGDPAVTNPSKLALVTRLTNAVTSWTDLSATLNTTTKTLIKAGQSGRNEYAVFEKVSGLPIKLISFDAVPNGSEIELHWATATEVNNDFFTIERTNDGVNFEELEKVKGSGNTSTEMKYSTVDKKPLTGLFYYRLRQTDFDGKTEVFNLVPVHMDKSSKEESFEVLKTYPNPFNEKVNVELNCGKAVVLTIDLLSLDGRTIHHEMFDCAEGNNTYAYLQQSHINPGNYILNISDNEGFRKTIKLMKTE